MISPWVASAPEHLWRGWPEWTAFGNEMQYVLREIFSKGSKFRQSQLHIRAIPTIAGIFRFIASSRNAVAMRSARATSHRWQDGFSTIEG
jgi:hypothetical protein